MVTLATHGLRQSGKVPSGKRVLLPGESFISTKSGVELTIPENMIGLVLTDTLISVIKDNSKAAKIALTPKGKRP